MPRTGLFRKQESLDYTAIPAGIQSHCSPPHTAQIAGDRSSSQCHFQSGGTDWTATRFLSLTITSFISDVGKRKCLGEKIKSCQANKTLLCCHISAITLNLTAANYSVELQSPLVSQSGLGCSHKKKRSVAYMVSDTPSSEDFTVILEFHLTTYCTALGSKMFNSSNKGFRLPLPTSERLIIPCPS